MSSTARKSSHLDNVAHEDVLVVDLVQLAAVVNHACGAQVDLCVRFVPLEQTTRESKCTCVSVFTAQTQTPDR